MSRANSMETRARSMALSCEILLEDTKRRNQVSGRYKLVQGAVVWQEQGEAVR
jgi:hypothetical protein